MTEYTADKSERRFFQVVIIQSALFVILGLWGYMEGTLDLLLVIPASVIFVAVLGFAVRGYLRIRHGKPPFASMEVAADD